MLSRRQYKFTMFQRNALPPSSGSKIKTGKQLARSRQQAEFSSFSAQLLQWNNTTLGNTDLNFMMQLFEK
jgi:hypothetical protein